MDAAFPIPSFGAGSSSTPASAAAVTCVSHGAVSLMGRRREIEDMVAVAQGFVAAHDFFGVYDGHGGAAVSQALKDRLHLAIAAAVAAAGGPDAMGAAAWEEVLAETFVKFDGEVTAEVLDASAKMGTLAGGAVGSTAIAAVVGATRIMVANCGDSRAVLCRGGVPIPLSQDHKPERPDELERVEAAGGQVISWEGYRILGILAISRSIGDYFLRKYVIPDPEITVTDRTDRDEFIILASDGLWDVVSTELACKTARKCLTGRLPSRFTNDARGRNGAAAASVLAKLALARGSKDNVSVIVVQLKWISGRSRRSRPSA